MSDVQIYLTVAPLVIATVAIVVAIAVHKDILKF